MAVARSIGDADGARAGGTILTLLGSAHIFLILQSLAVDVKGQFELRRDAGSPAQSTLRGHFRVLEKAGAMVKRRHNSFPGDLEYELLEPGRELLVVAETLEHWLEEAPAGRLELGGDPAKAAIKGLVDGWSSTILGRLATVPHSLIELDEAIDIINYPTIERRLGALRLAGQIDVAPTNGAGRGKSYVATEWVRHGIAPLVAAARWEHRNKQDGIASIAPQDLECAFMLIAPILEASAAPPTPCRLSVTVRDDKRRRGATGWIESADGEVTYSSESPEGILDSWASGSSAGWFSALIEGDIDDLDLGGNRGLARAMLDLLHQTLFGQAGEIDDITADLHG